MENETLIYRDTSVTEPNLAMQSQIVEFQSYLQNLDNENFIVYDDKASTKVCPLKHTFSDGIYVREITDTQKLQLFTNITRDLPYKTLHTEEETKNFLTKIL